MELEDIEEAFFASVGDSVNRNTYTRPVLGKDLSKIIKEKRTLSAEWRNAFSNQRVTPSHQGKVHDVVQREALATVARRPGSGAICGTAAALERRWQLERLICQWRIGQFSNAHSGAAAECCVNVLVLVYFVNVSVLVYFGCLCACTTARVACVYIEKYESIHKRWNYTWCMYAMYACHECIAVLCMSTYSSKNLCTVTVQ